MSNDHNKKIGTFYGVGIGPGDPGLLTIKGSEILRDVDYVFAPRASVKVQSLAIDIVKDIVSEDKIVTVVFPMTKDREELQSCWKDAAEQVYEKIMEGHDVAFVTIGDPGIYSTYTYLLRYLKECPGKVPVKTVPGISIVNAASARFCETIVEGDERFAVMPLPKDLNEIKQYAKVFDTIVLLKINKRLFELVDFLKSEGCVQSICFVHRLGCEDEYATNSLDDLVSCKEEMGYFSTMIIRSA